MNRLGRLQPPPATASAIAVVPGETVLFQALFTPNAILRWLKTEVMITDRRVITRRPLTWFLLFERGFVERSSPLKHVTQFTYGDATSARRLVLGVVLILTLVLAPFGVYLILTARSIALTFQNTGSGELTAHADKGERAQVDAAAHVINSLFGGQRPPPAPASPEAAPSSPEGAFAAAPARPGSFSPPSPPHSFGTPVELNGFGAPGLSRAHGTPDRTDVFGAAPRPDPFGGR